MSNHLTDIFGPTPECPALEDLGKPNHQQHLTNCAYCSAQFAMLSKFESGEPAGEEKEVVAAIVSRLRKESPAAPESWWSKIWRPKVLLPVIAFAAAALVLGLYVNSPSRSLNMSPDNVIRSNRLVAITPVGQIAELPSQLRWQTVPGTAKYNIRMLEVDRTEVWTTSSDTPFVEIPSTTQARIVPLKTLLWEVSAVDSTGKVLAESGLQRFVRTR